MIDPATGPRFRLAPGTLLRGGRPPASKQPAGIRNTSWDRAALAVSVDPSWLLAPLYARDVAGLVPPGTGYPGRLEPPVTGDERAAGNPVTDDTATAGNPVTDETATAGNSVTVDGTAAADWPTWWAGALAYRPGTPAPRPQDLFGDSAALADLWQHVQDGFRRWISDRPAPDPRAATAARNVEAAALAAFSARNDREPGRWTVRILQIPAAGHYLHSPEPRRIVISAALRADPDRYAAALGAELPRHF
jgi:hypothetical protein